jgi:hypothetical protein
MARQRVRAESSNEMRGPFRAFLATVAGCGVIAAATPAVAASSRAATIGITANSRLPRVSGDVLVAYNAGTFARATISGVVTGGRGDRVQLQAERFGSRTFTAAGPARAVARSGKYSFAVQPPVVTRYRVLLLAGRRILRRSRTVPVYVEATVRRTGGGRCHESPCVQTLQLSVTVPPSVYRREAGKHWYLYSGLRLGQPGHIPPLPRVLMLDKHARASRARRAHADEFLVTLRFTFNIGARSYRLAMNYCTRDSLAADGLGLPGHHGCGGRSIRLDAGYLG